MTCRQENGISHQIAVFISLQVHTLPDQAIPINLIPLLGGAVNPWKPPILENNYMWIYQWYISCVALCYCK